MVSSLSHFSHAIGLKDKDGLCSEGLIDQNNCASICLLKAERTTASQGLYFHQLSQPLMLLTWLVLICCRTARKAGNIQHGKAILKLHCPKKRAHLLMQNECYKCADRRERGTKTRGICSENGML